MTLKEPNMNNPRRNRGFRGYTTVISSEGAEYNSNGIYFSSGMIQYARRRPENNLIPVLKIVCQDVSL
jgi:hypothetical protein